MSKWFAVILLITGWFALAGWVAGAPDAGAGPGGTPPGAARRTWFWDQYMAARRLVDSTPDSAAARARTRLAADPDDIVASWITGALAVRTPADSARAAELLAQAAAKPASPGRQVAAGTACYAASRIEDGRAAFERARAAYTARHRVLDAAHASLLRVVLRRARGDLKTWPGDVADAETRARDTGDAMTTADAKLFSAATTSGGDPRKQYVLQVEALALIDSLGPSYQLMECHRGLAATFRRVGTPDSAEAHMRAALEVARVLSLPSEEGRCLSGLARIRGDRGDLAGYVDLSRRSLALSEANDHGGDLANAYANLATALQRVGRVGEAIRMREKAVDALRAPAPGTAGGAPGATRAAPNADDLTLGLDQLGTVEAMVGNLEAGRKHLEEAAAIARDPAVRQRLPFVMLHLGQVYADLDDLDRADRCAREGLEAADEPLNTRAKALLGYFKASLQRLRGKDDDALAALENASSSARPAALEVLWLTGRAEAELRLARGAPREAVAVLDSMMQQVAAQAMQTPGSRPDSVEFARSLTVKARALVAAGDARGASAVAAHALLMARAFPQPALLAGALDALGQAELALGRSADAVRDLTASVAISDTLSRRLTFRTDRNVFRTPVDEARCALARAWAASGHPDSAFDVAERARARDTGEVFGVAAPGIDRRAPDDLRAALVDLETELAGARAALNQEYARMAPMRSPDTTLIIARRDSLTLAWEQLAGRLVRDAPAYAQAIGLAPAMTSAGVRGALAPGERVISFMAGERRSLRFDVDPGAVRATELAWGDRDLADRVGEYGKAVLTTDTGGMSLAAGLADTLLGGGRSARATGPEIFFIIPDGALRELPFETLRVRDASGNRSALIERGEVVYGLSGASLFGTTPPSGGSATFPAGTPAPDSEIPVVLADPRGARWLRPGDDVFAAAVAARLAGLDAGAVPGEGAAAARANTIGGTPAVVVFAGTADAASRDAFTAEFRRRLAGGEKPATALRAIKLAAIRSGAPPASWAEPMLFGGRR